MTLEVQFRIQDAADFLFQDADPGATIHGAMESSLREVIGKSRLDDIITENRSAIAISVQQGTQALLDLYRTGLIVTNVNIQRAEAPEQVAEAFADAIRAREDKERLQNQARPTPTTWCRVHAARRHAWSRTRKVTRRGWLPRPMVNRSVSWRCCGVRKGPERDPRAALSTETMQDVLRNTGKVLLDVKGAAI